MIRQWPDLDNKNHESMRREKIIDVAQKAIIV
jgi:hypothetical protein